jgi:hypothetical protein
MAPREGGLVFDEYVPAAPPTVVAREKRAIQYSEASVIERSCGVLDTPLEPVIGLAMRDPVAEYDDFLGCESQRHNGSATKPPK